MEHKIKNFDDETIQTLFGYEDAESESLERLKSYYFKNETYARIVANLPLRILVGHKGTGKSALFKIAMSEDKENGDLPILIKPDDVAELGKNNENFLLKIRQWKLGLIKIVGEKVFSEFGIFDDDIKNKLSRFGLKLVSYITDTVKVVQENVDLSASQIKLINNYLEKSVLLYISMT